MVFEALYYNGNSSFGNKATIHLLESSIKIDIGTETILWNSSELSIRESFFNKGKSVLKYGSSFPYPALEISGAEFPVYFERSYPSIKIKQTDISVFQNTGNRAIVLIILGVLGIILLAYFVFIPFVAEQVAKRIPMRYEIAMGDKMFEQLSNSFDVDSEQTILANSFFHQLKIPESYPVNITVVHSEISNAFAFPGGHIVVHDNMFKLMKSKEEFAALLCHEYSHIEQRHITRSLFRNLGTYLVISLLLSDVNGIMAVLLENADNLKSLSYSRKLEQEADEKGLQLMNLAAQNPEGMIQLFKHLEKANEGSPEIPEYLSTHPMLEGRMKNIKQLSKNSVISVSTNLELDATWKKLKALN